MPKLGYKPILRPGLGIRMAWLHGLASQTLSLQDLYFKNYFQNLLNQKFGTDLMEPFPVDTLAN